MKDKTDTAYFIKPVCDTCHNSISGKLTTKHIQLHDWEKPLYRYELVHECCGKVYRYEITLVTQQWNKEIVSQYEQ